MMRAALLALAGMVIAPTVMLGCTGPASAATNMFGSDCTSATQLTSSTGIMALAAAGDTLPVGAPMTGVITQVTVTLPGTVAGAEPLEVKVARPGTEPDTYRVLAEGAISATAGRHTYDVTVPVTAGDLLGLGGAHLPICSAAAGDVTFLASGDNPVGSDMAYAPSSGTALPVVATVELDADHDGFGDVTQDQCPESSATRLSCPVIGIDSFAAPGRGAITVVVAVDHQATVAVSGSTTVGGRKVTLHARPATAYPGQLARFKVRLPKPVRRALAHGHRVKVSLTATATNIIGSTSTDSSRVRLRAAR